MPRNQYTELFTGDYRVDVRRFEPYDKPHEYVTYFLLGALVCSLIAAMANEERGPKVQARSGLAGFFLGGLLCVGANTLIGMVMMSMAHRVSPDYMLTPRQYDPIHDLGFVMYYALVPSSLAIALTLSIGANRFIWMRGLLSAGLAAVISGLLIHIALAAIIPFVIVGALKNPTQGLDLNGMIKALLIAHLFGMGLGAAIAFALAQAIYRAAWLRGLNGLAEGRSLHIPAPVAMVGCAEGSPIFIPPDGTIAPMHAQIDTTEERHLIRPAQGVVVINGRPIQEHWLLDNDVVELGAYRFQYRTRLSPSSQAPAPPPVVAGSPPARGPLAMPVSGELVIEDSMGGKHVVAQGTTVIGRDPGLGISLGWEPTVSRKHAEIQSGPAGCTVIDLGSSNGTFVNGTAITGRQSIGPGDELRLGKCVLKLSVRAPSGVS